MIAMLLFAAAAATPTCDMDGPQMAMNMCARQQFEAADAVMNAQWARTLAVMQQRDRDRLDRKYDSRIGYVAALRAAQRTWISFRDQHCTVEAYEARGGSMEPMVYSLCQKDVTEARTTQLKALTEAY